MFEMDVRDIDLVVKSRVGFIMIRSRGVCGNDLFSFIINFVVVRLFFLNLFFVREVVVMVYV